MHKILWKINVVDEEMIRNGCNIVSKPICDILFQSESSPQAWSRNAISVHFKVGIVHQHHIIIILLLSSAANVCRNVKWTTTTTTVVVAVCVMEFLRLFAICQHLPASPRTLYGNCHILFKDWCSAIPKVELYFYWFKDELKVWISNGNWRSCSFKTHFLLHLWSPKSRFFYRSPMICVKILKLFL